MFCPVDLSLEVRGRIRTTTVRGTWRAGSNGLEDLVNDSESSALEPIADASESTSVSPSPLTGERIAVILSKSSAGYLNVLPYLPSQVSSRIYMYPRRILDFSMVSQATIK